MQIIILQIVSMFLFLTNYHLANCICALFLVALGLIIWPHLLWHICELEGLPFSPSSSQQPYL